VTDVLDVPQIARLAATVGSESQPLTAEELFPALLGGTADSLGKSCTSVGVTPRSTEWQQQQQRRQRPHTAAHSFVRTNGAGLRELTVNSVLYQYVVAISFCYYSIKLQMMYYFL
jgi:hypothetical protein